MFDILDNQANMYRIADYITGELPDYSRYILIFNKGEFPWNKYRLVTHFKFFAQSIGYVL